MYLRSCDLYFSKLVIEDTNLELNKKKYKYYMYEQKSSRVEIKVIARAERLGGSKKSSSLWNALYSVDLTFVSRTIAAVLKADLPQSRV